MKARKGFTLVELLIVMAIIAALTAILVPIARGAIAKAKATKIATILNNLVSATQQYIYIKQSTPSPGEGQTVIDVLLSEGFIDKNPGSDYSVTVSNSGGTITITAKYDPDTTKTDEINKSIGDEVQSILGQGITLNGSGPYGYIEYSVTITQFW